jgi:hypothetical protein
MRKMSWFSGLLSRVIWWLETNVRETVLHPSSGLNFVIKEMYTLRCCLTREVPDAQFEVFSNNLGPRYF